MPEIRPQFRSFHLSRTSTAMIFQSSSSRFFTLFAVALEVALVWALFHAAFRFEPDDPPSLCRSHECLAAVPAVDPITLRSFS
jgi:hypothetical protein